MPKLFQKLVDYLRGTKNPSVTVEELKIGNILELTYKHPREVGIVGEDSLTVTRLNQDELDNRTIQGTVTNVFREKSLYKWFLCVRVYKNNNGISSLREFTFMEDEIESFRLLS